MGLFCESFPPVMDGVAVCMQNYAYWIQKKVGGVCVVVPNAPGADYSTYDYKVFDYLSIPVPGRHPYVTGVAEMDPTYLAKIAATRFQSSRYLEWKVATRGMPCRRATRSAALPAENGVCA